MSLTRLIPGPDQTWNADDPGLMSALTELYAPPARPGGSIRINMIASLNGSAVGGDGTSETLSNRMDRAILKVIRSLADQQPGPDDVEPLEANVRQRVLELALEPEVAVAAGRIRTDGRDRDELPGARPPSRAGEG